MNHARDLENEDFTYILDNNNDFEMEITFSPLTQVGIAHFVDNYGISEQSETDDDVVPNQ